MNTSLPVPKAPICSALPQGDLVLHVGQMFKVKVGSAEEASRIWTIIREAFNLGGSESPNVLLKHQGQTVGYVSYNGRVWKGRPTDPIKVQSTRKPVAEAAVVKELRVGDYLPIEDMANEITYLAKVAYIDDNYVGFDLAPGMRIAVMKGRVTMDHYLVPMGSFFK